MKNGLGARNNKEEIVESSFSQPDLWWDKRLHPHFIDERVHIAPGIVWCGEMNILPTAINPFSGLESYAGMQSCVLPHVKMFMQSVPSGKYEDTKFNYTTGTVTQRNYIQRKAGLKAEQYHSYGGLLVEVDSDGDWFVRQLQANDAGTIHDLNIEVRGGALKKNVRPLAILHGDIHVSQLNDEIYNIVWGDTGLMDTLKPKEQHLGDILTFSSKSHHDDLNPHRQYKLFIQGKDDIQAELLDVFGFLRKSKKPYCKSIVINSNHHNHMKRWLLEKKNLEDYTNVKFWFDFHSRVYKLLLEKPNAYIDYFQEGLKIAVNDPKLKGLESIKFLREDESYILAGDIECGMHGHLGPNGSRGNIRTLARTCRKANIGHSHTAGIVEGVYQAGTYSKLDLDWTHGPSSWTHSSVLTHANGMRQIITFYNGKWRA